MIPFSSYMREWLYGKDGYYHKASIGQKGDFYTSVSSSRFFGGTIAHHLLDLLETKKLTLPLKIIEIGADKGHLLSDIAQFLSALSVGAIQDCEFISIEPLPGLALIQENNFLMHTGLKLKIYKDLQDLNLDISDCAFLYCNELFDAFPCEIFDNGKMAYADNHRIFWKKPSDEILSLADKCGVFQGQIPVDLENFIFKLTEKLKHVKIWRFLTFDYGQWGARNDINLRVYQNHQVYHFLDIEKKLENFYQNSDITYDVDFSLICYFFESFGAKKLLFESQAKALLDLGLGDLLEKFSQNTSYQNYLREISKIKPLISPGGLGERFQAIEFGNGVNF
ncbi:hypothetical protein BKH41_01025 [Helicobacter sp. 12S02232-10]|uniref:SAM-dependent methyltransferase n=1 Tax=Helicobacter sp. 12S02232-10 TaxID=1476197 RepID=UPI000BA584C5|nr:SAM-dependent methyltransferase [Helicobacter sp. 12S02232-10]PAF49915.1 hypothetical protein BKH41_01025 [Helicobacter sp. 12S02232-10]